jgi:hypothetical protein
VRDLEGLVVQEISHQQIEREELVADILAAVTAARPVKEEEVVVADLMILLAFIQQQQLI